MTSCVIFGGSGYIGTKLAEHLTKVKRFETIYVVDIRKSPLQNDKVIYVKGDVREPMNLPGVVEIEWIFNLAAVHREPGHKPEEYYLTNILGATNVCDFASRVNCKNMLFTASISVYGPTLKPTDESTLTMPNTPYGISKLTAEYIHKVWAEKMPDRRLISVRPGVIYGPGDPGNILRMIRAIKKGYFLLPTTSKIKKSYGYVHGLLDSIDFTMDSSDKVIVYNYVERETETLGDMISIINSTLNYRGQIVRFPFWLLKIVAAIVHKINPNINGIHPERVKKVARPTHIVPGVLINRGFSFKYDFKNSLTDWREKSPYDFL